MRTSQSEGPTTDREPQKYEGDAVGRPQPVTFRLTASNGKVKEITICRAYVSREMTVGSQIARVRWVKWSSCDYSKGLGYCRCSGSAVYNIEEVHAVPANVDRFEPRHSRTREISRSS